VSAANMVSVDDMGFRFSFQANDCFQFSILNFQF
jgi:hypothetical protein